MIDIRKRKLEAYYIAIIKGPPERNIQSSTLRPYRIQIAGELSRLRRPLHLRIVRNRANFPFLLVAQLDFHARPFLLQIHDTLRFLV